MKDPSASCRINLVYPIFSWVIYGLDDFNDNLSINLQFLSTIQGPSLIKCQLCGQYPEFYELSIMQIMGIGCMDLSYTYQYILFLFGTGLDEFKSA